MKGTATPEQRARWNRKYYLATPERNEQRHAAKKRSIELAKEFVYGYLSVHPCTVCGESDPVVLEFDHIDPSTKHRAIAVLVSNGYSVTRISAEIEKCVVMCANCHRRKTAQERGYYTTRMGA